MATVVVSLGTGVTRSVVHANYSVTPDPYPSGATITSDGKTLANVVNNSTITIYASETVTGSAYTMPVYVYRNGQSGWEQYDYLQSTYVSVPVYSGTTYIRIGPATVKQTLSTVVVSLGAGVTRCVMHATYGVTPDPFPNGKTVTSAGTTLANVEPNTSVTVYASETTLASGYTTPVNLYKSSDGKSWTKVDYFVTGYASTTVGSGTTYIRVGPATVSNYKYRVKVYGRQSSYGGVDQIKYYPSETTWYNSTSASPSFSLSNVSLSAPPGYALLGYAPSASPSSGETSYKQSMTLSASASGTVNNIHANWVRYYYRVRYFYNNGSGDSAYWPATGNITTVSTSGNFDLSNLPTPRRDGYVFKGWAQGSTDTTGQTVYTSSIPISATSSSSSSPTINNIHAVWEQQKSYRVHAFGNGGTSGSVEDVYVPTSGYTYTTASTVNFSLSSIPGFTRSGYRLIGWAYGSAPTSGETVYTSTISIAPSYDGVTQNVHAVWERVSYSYKVRCFYNDGSGGSKDYPSVGYYESDTPSPTFDLTRLQTPTRTGYNFVGWANGAVPSEGETAHYPTMLLTAGTDATNPYINNIHAVWEKRRSYRIHAFGNGGQSIHGNDDEWSPSQDEWYYTDETSVAFDLLRLPVFTKTGYDFVGWAYSTASGETVYTDTITVYPSFSGETLNIYAVWGAKYKYRLRIYGNGGTTSGGLTNVYSPSSSGWYYSETASVQFAVSNVGDFKNGRRHFVGWAYQASPTQNEIVYPSTINLSATTDGYTNTVHAVWADEMARFTWYGSDAEDNAKIVAGKQREMTASMWASFANKVEELAEAIDITVSVDRVSSNGRMLASQYNSAVTALALIRLAMSDGSSVPMPSRVSAGGNITAAQFNAPKRSLKGSLNGLIGVYNSGRD